MPSFGLIGSVWFHTQVANSERVLCTDTNYNLLLYHVPLHAGEVLCQWLVQRRVTAVAGKHKRVTDKITAPSLLLLQYKTRCVRLLALGCHRWGAVARI